jgi:hypothetical protein
MTIGSTAAKPKIFRPGSFVLKTTRAIIKPKSVEIIEENRDTGMLFIMACLK